MAATTDWDWECWRSGVCPMPVGPGGGVLAPIAQIAGCLSGKRLPKGKAHCVLETDRSLGSEVQSHTLEPQRTPASLAQLRQSYGLPVAGHRDTAHFTNRPVVAAEHQALSYFVGKGTLEPFQINRSVDRYPMNASGHA